MRILNEVYNHTHTIDISNVIDYELDDKEANELWERLRHEISYCTELLSVPFDTFVMHYKKYHSSIGGDVEYRAAFHSYKSEEKDDMRNLMIFLFLPQLKTIAFLTRISYETNVPVGKEARITFQFSSVDLIMLATSSLDDIKDETLGTVDEDIEQVILVMLLPLLNALVLMNCKNVILQDEPQAKLKRMLNKHSRNKKTIYKVLVVKPFSTRKHYLESQKTGIKRSMHVCRGHLRTYTEDSKLFGKYTGTYYIPPHIRGDKKIGKVIKDYKLLQEQI